MSWLVSFIFAGLMFTSQSNPTIYTTDNLTNPNAPRIVRLDETERFEQTYPFNANGKISVSNVNGSVTIDAWDRNEIKLEAVKTADTKERLSDVKIKIDAHQDSFNVETDYSAWNRNDGTWKNKNNGKLEVQYHLSVPRTAILDEIGTVNGSVTISNMTGTTKASAVNGSVKATNLRGNSDLSTVNGVTEADFDTLENGNKVSLSTVNGQVHLLIPSDADATIKAETVSGNIVNDFGLPVRKGRYVGRDMYGKVGSGSAIVKLDSVNGELSVRRKQDGKNVKPAVNLLPEKSKDDDNEDSDAAPKAIRESNIAARAAARDAAREANRESARAMADAQKEVEKANVDSARAMADAQKEIERARVNLAPLPKIVTTINTEQIKEQIEMATRIQTEALTKVNAINWNWNWRTGTPIVEKKTDSFTVQGIPKVTIDAKNCKVSVRGWDKPEVRYSIVRLTRNSDQKPLDYKANHGDTDVSIKVNEPDADADDANGAADVRVEVFVPKKSNLRILTNREIRVEGVSGDLNLTGEAESINVRDVDGKLTVASTEGGIRVIGFSGEICSKSAGGTISLEGDFQKLSAQTDNGTILLTLPENANAIFQSNSEIKSEGFDLVKDDDDHWKLGDGGVNYRLQTDDGQVVIRNLNQIKNSY